MSNGILFNGAALWEEYLAVILADWAKKSGQYLFHPNNRSGAGRQYLFVNDENRRKNWIYPDFLLQPQTGKAGIISAKTVLDAKYKNLNGDIGREDSLQMLAYMLRFSAAKALLFYPVKGQSQPAVLDLIQGKNCPSRQVIVFPFEIPACNRDDTFGDFTEKMKKAEESLQVLIGSVVSQS